MKFKWFVRIYVAVLFFSIALWTLYDPVVIWLESPDGNMVWDILLQALGIIITVFVIQRYFERKEEKRWLPVRQDLYSQLFSNAEYLVRLLPYEFLPKSRRVHYKFGYRDHSSQLFPEKFITKVVRAQPNILEDRVKALAENPEIMESFREGLNDLLGSSSIVFLIREPELNRHINEVKESLSQVIVTLETYRRVLETGRDPARVGCSSALQQACITLQNLIISGYKLRKWLISQADAAEPLDF